ncbi:MAG: PHP-associated domain-containing protein [Candidatus Methylacidiphilales bacterium]|nr:PHP domain-containing protein [Candidatus Methylacidiphilales bacterium]
MPRYRVDFHGHCKGDPMDDLPHTVYQYIDRSVERGLNAIAITWHRKQFDIPDAIDYARDRGLLLIPGIETEVNGVCHTLVLNAPPGEVGPTSTLEDLRRLKKYSQVLIIAPHPYYPLRNCLGRIIEQAPDCFDGVEWCHLHVPFIPSFINPNRMAQRWAAKHDKPVVACSDAHCLDSIACNYSEVEADALTTEAIFAGIRAKRVWFQEKAFSLKLLWRAIHGVIVDPPWASKWAVLGQGQSEGKTAGTGSDVGVGANQSAAVAPSAPATASAFSASASVSPSASPVSSARGNTPS